MDNLWETDNLWGDDGFEILAAGEFGRGQVVVHWSHELRETAADLERLIEEAWAVRAREAQRLGKMLYPGKLCRLIGFSASAERLNLELGATDFRELVGTNLGHPEWLRSLGPTYLSNALGVHAAVGSSDGKLIMYRRSALVAECPGCFDACGGHVEPDFDCPDGIPDPFSSIAREIQEEMGIGPTEIVSVTCLGLARATATFKPDLIFSVRTNRPSSSLLRGPLSEEHAAVKAIGDDESSVRRFLQRYGKTMAPAGRATLLLRYRQAKGKLK